MVSTTLGHIERDGAYLMLLRNKKKNDLNEGKWIGIGGHVEAGETPAACMKREAYEETGLTLHHPKLRGVVEFRSERWEDEHMYVYTCPKFEGELTECSEGELRWIPKEQIFDLPLWEGDKVFLNYLLSDEPFFHLELRYDAEDRLVGAEQLPKLILASQSPRRYELLTQIGLMPVVLPSEKEEKRHGEGPEELVKNLSAMKAEDVAETYAFSNGEVVLGADTIVVVDGEILGKPHTHEEAAEMIRRLQGRTHEVLSGVTLIRCGGPKGRVKKSFAVRTEVTVYPMTEEEILLYAESDEPMDKAGAYGIQGSFAAFIKGISGDYSNVVGLPVGRVWHELRDFL